MIIFSRINLMKNVLFACLLFFVLNLQLSNAQSTFNLYCSTKSPGGQITEGMLVVDIKNSKVSYLKEKNLNAEITADSVFFGLRGSSIRVNFHVNRYSGAMTVFSEGSVIASGTCEKVSIKNF